jgi:hypothetical protein
MKVRPGYPHSASGQTYYCKDRAMVLELWNRPCRLLLSYHIGVLCMMSLIIIVRYRRFQDQTTDLYSSYCSTLLSYCYDTPQLVWGIIHTLICRRYYNYVCHFPDSRRSSQHCTVFIYIYITHFHSSVVCKANNKSACFLFDFCLVQAQIPSNPPLATGAPL